MRIAFAISRAASVDETWTTVHLAREALVRGWQVRFVEPWDFELDSSSPGRSGGRLIARAHAFDAPCTAEELARALVEREADRRYVELDRLDLLLLRAAPFDLSVLTFGAMAKSRGVPVFNDPEGLLRVTSKAWLAGLVGVPIPPTLVTRSRASAHLFATQQPEGVVLKPARGSGGRQVSFVSPVDPDVVDLAFDEAREGGDGYVVVQAYLPEADDGEKRLVWLDGVVVGGYLRRRAPGEFRHNLKRGGTAEPTDITAEDRALGRSLAPHLTRAGIRLAGIDAIGGRVIEVNALNPGGAFHADRLGGTRLGALILDRLIHRPEESTSPWAAPVP